jgi:Asp-tRNA(Asn)/Glu-tRNA(Gln) amidotransferase A subunit family amidase
MRIHIICAVRGSTKEQQEEVDAYVAELEAAGHQVHNPKYAVDQNDPTGYGICFRHYTAMQAADRVDIFWDSESKGSHFDLGMAFALGKKVKLVRIYGEDYKGKSFLKVIREIERKFS